MSKLVALYSVLSLTLAVGVTAAEPYPVTLVDDRGQTITIAAPPQRIVVAGSPLYTEVLLAFDARDRLVAVTDSPNNPEGVADLPRIGPSLSPNVELILALVPDLVLGAADWGGERRTLEAAGITVLTTPFIAGLPDVFYTVRTVGAAIGRSTQAEELVGRLAERIVTIESRVLGEQPVRAAFLYAPSREGSPYAAGTGAIEGELLLRAGGENPFADIAGYAEVSLEELVLRNPEAIFTDPSQIENILENPLLQSVSAVKGRRVYGVPASYVLSIRVAEALFAMAEALHPER